jgi:hypothetical protein
MRISNARSRTAMADLKPALLIVFLLLIPFLSQAQTKNEWAGWDFLLGEWVSGESSGVPGNASSGSFTLSPDLGGKILVRKNHAEYPPSNGRPAIVHDDLMIIYHEGGAAKAFYTDSEGHVIRYGVTLSPDSKKLVFLSEKTSGSPQYKLSYVNVQPGRVKLTFEIAPPDKPEEFKTYVEAVVKRKLTTQVLKFFSRTPGATAPRVLRLQRDPLFPAAVTRQWPVLRRVQAVLRA